jgi:outer membrane protein assembly factor BamB
MVMKMAGTARLLILLPLMFAPLNAGDWPTFGHDPQRSGWAFEETVLTVENVSGLELKWKARMENEPKSLTALTAPIVASHVSTPQGIKTLVYVAGSADHLFALDAENGKVVWTRTFDSHVVPKDAGMWLCPNGINATPALDKSRGLIFAVAVDGRLYGLDLGTGETRFGPIQFVPAFSKNWSLNLESGVIYTAISQGCAGAQSGIYGLDTTDSARPAIRDLLVSHHGDAGIWGRGGPVIGKNGRIYAATGDGEFNPAAAEYGSSFIAASLPDLKVLDFYSPTDYRHITKYDLDISASSPVWFANRNYNLLAGGGKEGILYLLDADSLGDKDHQTPLFIAPRLGNDEETFQAKGIWGALSSWTDPDGQVWVYVPVWGPPSEHAPKFPQTDGPAPHGSIMAFRVSLDAASKKPFLEPSWMSRDFDLPEPVVIANSVVFALSTGENPQQTMEGGVIYTHQTLLTDAQRAANTRHAILYALNATTGKVLYESGNLISGWVHFSGLALAEGQVYAVDHDSQVYCFGLKAK